MFGIIKGYSNISPGKGVDINIQYYIFNFEHTSYVGSNKFCGHGF